MNETLFAIDTNLLVYAVDREDLSKRERAQLVIDLAIRTDRSVLPLQAVGEFFVATTRRGIERSEVGETARALLRLFRIAAPQGRDAAAALDLAVPARLSYWDALLLATIARNGCRYLLTEDMQNGAEIMGVRIRNPLLGEELAPDLVALLAPAPGTGAP